MMNRRRALMTAQSPSRTEAFVKVGNPEIVGGILKTTSTNWITMSFPFAPSAGDTWEFVVALNRYNKNDFCNILDSPNYGLRFRSAWSNDSVKPYLGSTGTSYNIDDGSNNINCPVNTWVWVKFVFTGERYEYYRSLNGTTYTLVNTKAKTDVMASSLISFGSSTSQCYFNLNETYIKVNGVDFWKPYM